MPKMTKSDKITAVIVFPAMIILGIFVFYSLLEFNNSLHMHGTVKAVGKEYRPYWFVYKNKGQEVGKYKKRPVYEIAEDPEHNFLVMVNSDGSETQLINTEYKPDFESEPCVAYFDDIQCTDPEVLRVLDEMNDHDYKEARMYETDSLDGFYEVWVGRGSSPVAYHQLGYLGQVEFDGRMRTVFAEYGKARYDINYNIIGYDMKCNFMPQEFSFVLNKFLEDPTN